MDIKQLNKEVERLVNIMEKLRSPEGCPWDRKQDYYSLRPYILEEAYEVVEALDNENLELLKEELGDLLLQVVFQAQIGREKGDFDLIDIFSGISKKLIRRHPHVFGDIIADEISEVMVNWEKIKEEEKADKGIDRDDSILDDFSQGQPALNQAYEIQDLAADVGFDWDDKEDVVDKIEEELEEVKEAIRNEDRENIGDELGDLLFAVVNLTRFFDINPELALLGTIKKFRDRFYFMEKEVSKKGDKMEQLSLAELDEFWEKSKEGEKC